MVLSSPRSGICALSLGLGTKADSDLRHHLVGFVLAVLALVFAGSPPMQAVEPGEMLSDPVLEERAQAIGAEVRCLVCRNESVEDSNADLARDLRLVIRERLVAGDTDEEVSDFLVDRFGEYVLLRPRFGGSTLWLWLIGPMLLIFGAVIAGRFVTAKAQSTSDALTDEEQAKIQELMKK